MARGRAFHGRSGYDWALYWLGGEISWNPTNPANLNIVSIDYRDWGLTWLGRELVTDGRQRSEIKRDQFNWYLCMTAHTQIREIDAIENVEEALHGKLEVPATIGSDPSDRAGGRNQWILADTHLTKFDPRAAQLQLHHLDGNVGRIWGR